MNHKVIYFTKNTDLVYTHINCPHCGEHDFVGVPVVMIECRKCQKRSRSDLKQSMFEKMLHKVMYELRWNNGVVIRAQPYYHRDIMQAHDIFMHTGFIKLVDVEEIEEDNKKLKKKERWLQLTLERKEPYEIK